jgi:tetratricopeptide (TPR) repeat protein
MTQDEKITEAQTALLEGDLRRAEYLYQEALHDKKNILCALDGLGVLNCRRGDSARGIQYFEEALQFLRKESESNPNGEATLLFHLGLAFRMLGNQNEALHVFGQAVKLSSEMPDLLLNLGQIHFELEQFNEAIRWFRQLSVIQPDNASAWLTLGYILSNESQYSEAVDALLTAERLDSASPEICFHLAEALRKAERYKDSLPYYQKMLQVAADYPQAVTGYGKSLLALGYLEDGWDAIEFRLVSTFGTWERHHLETWKNETENAPKRVLAYSEEGIAAELMFASCLPDLINSVDECVVECEESLHNLFKRSFPRATFVPLTPENVEADKNSWGINLDAQIAFGSLPRYFRRQKEDFPLRKAYLVPDKDRVEKWLNRLAMTGDAKKIGVLWQGNWSAESAKQTALPTEELRKLVQKHRDAAWVSLQHGSKQKEFGANRSELAPRIFAEAFQYDLDNMAALITALDLVITPPGYVAHLAGALGVRTWLLLPEGSDWRWNIASESGGTVWHPSMQIYRQTFGQNWSEVFSQLGNDLDKFLTKYRPPEEVTIISPITLAFPEQYTIEKRKVA